MSPKPAAQNKSAKINKTPVAQVSKTTKAKTTPAPVHNKSADTPAAAKKTPSKKTSSSSKDQKPPALSPAERMKMIAEAAYFRAANRGFTLGNDLDDWVAAEQQIDSELVATAKNTRKKTTKHA